MKLRNPGPIRPAPDLHGQAATIAEAVERMVGVTAHTHWMRGDSKTVDGAEYHLGDLELGHVHLDGSVHLPMGPLAASVVDASLAAYPPWSKTWVSLAAQANGSASKAIWLFELAHAQASGLSHHNLLDRIRTRAVE